MHVSVFDSLEDLAAAVRALPAAGLLPARTVLVRSERQAHALRVLLADEAGAALAGTRFVGPLTAAEEVLRAAGVSFTAGESGLRAARLENIFAAGLPLEHFPADLLTTTPGWAEAFASAIHALESAGLRPADLPRTRAQLRDLASVWARAQIEAEAGRSWSAVRIQAEAAAALERDPRAWPFPGPVLAPVDGHEPPVLARLVRAIPACAIALRAARPARARWVEQVGRLWGAEAAAAARLPRPPRAVRAAATEPAAEAVPEPVPDPTTELARLQALLFQPGAAAEGALGAGRGPDGTVELEEHAGVESELDATAAWVARKVLEDALPLARVAVLVPVQDPLAQLVADRVARLGVAVHVAGAVPAVSTSAGARVLAILRALRARLPADLLASVLPFLRVDEVAGSAGTAEGCAEAEATPSGAEAGRARRHLSHGDALALAFSLGTAGGSPARPEGALEWSGRARERAGELEAAIAVARASGGSDEREVWRLERTLAALRAVRGALDALVEVARAVHEARPLDVLWAALGAFLRDDVLLPGGADRTLGPLREALEPASAASLASLSLAGDAGLDAIRDALLSLRAGRGRFGEPAVYVGTVASAAGLTFDAVRIIGLAEGSIPSAPREDPVLPGFLRELVEAHAGVSLPSPEDRITSQLHALHAVVLGTRRALALSAPRVDLARTEREPAALLVEVAAALARPHRRTGARAEPVPDAQALRRDAFEPARERAAAFRRDHPVTEGDWLVRAARGGADLPPRWRADAALELPRVAALFRPPVRLGARDGVLTAGAPFPPVPGLDPAHPISASALGDLLACPRGFLMRRVLRWKEAAAAPPLRALDAAAFGSLLHRAVERLYRDEGPAIVAGRRTLAHWLARGRDVADAAFAEFLLELPLLGAKVREKERARLHDAVTAFLEYDWDERARRPGRRFVDVERGFGTEDAPLALGVPGGVLHVRGYVDRLDATADRTIVRDLKSGRAHPREGGERGPVPGRDVQLGLYVTVARRLAGAWGVPARAVGAYAYASGRGEVCERAFEDDVAVLDDATERWLGLARALLAGRRFPSTPDPHDCGFCAFAPLCGKEEPARASAGLALERELDEDATLGAFLHLKRGEEER